MLDYKYIAVLISVLVFGFSDVKAVGPKVYNPPMVCECDSGGKCVCEVCKCGALAMADVKEKAPKTEEKGVGEVHKKVAKTKYLTYDEAVKLAKSDEEVVLITYVGIEPKPYPYVGPEVKWLIQCHAKALEGYNVGDIIVSKFYHGSHERIALNSIEDKVIHNTGVLATTSTQTVTWAKQCNGGVCSLVPVYSNSTPSSQQVIPAPINYYVPGVWTSPCANGNCNRK